MSKYAVVLVDMTRQDVRSIGSTFALALTIVSAVSLSARLYKEDIETQKVQAAIFQSSAIACNTIAKGK
jgi:hypothetical protein